VPLVIQCRGYLFPSLSLAALCQYLGVKPNAVEVAPNRSVRIESAQKGAFIIPIDRHGRMLINFYGGIRALEACTAHYSDVLAAVANGDPGRKLEDYKGKIVFIGGVDPLLKDLGTTPLATNFPMVGIHAFVVSNVLERSFVMRARHTTNRVLLFVFTFLVAGATARRSLRKGGLTAAVLVLAFGVAAHLCFAIGGLWINVVAPLGCMLSAYGAILTYRFFAEERERIRTRRWLVRYLSPDIVEEALQTPESLVFSGAMKKITVLLSDIRDFTPMTEELGPQMVVSMLNEYFTVMTRVVHKHGGSVNQFVGDEILAVFGAPVTKPDDARRALLTAVEMQAELQKLMSRWAEEGRRTFDIGMGLNTGEVVVGNIGSLEHMDYAVMGDTINYAARLESLTKTYKTRILLSHSTYEEVKDLVIAESLGHIQVKGRKNAEEVHKLIGLK
jgi:adenylate cyclase